MRTTPELHSSISTLSVASSLFSTCILIRDRTPNMMKTLKTVALRKVKYPFRQLQSCGSVAFVISSLLNSDRKESLNICSLSADLPRDTSNSDQEPYLWKIFTLIVVINSFPAVRKPQPRSGWSQDLDATFLINVVQHGLRTLFKLL